MRKLVLLFVLLCAPFPGVALEFMKCPQISEHFKHLRPITDERIIGIFSQVHARTGFAGLKFALCESEEFNPGNIEISEADREYAVILPRVIARFSDAVIRGLVAHELGHIPRLNEKTTQRLEREIDAVAVQWVGKDAVGLAIRMMLNNIERLPWWHQDIGELSLKDRLKALEFGPPPKHILLKPIGRRPL